MLLIRFFFFFKIVAYGDKVRFRKHVNRTTWDVLCVVIFKPWIGNNCEFHLSASTFVTGRSDRTVYRFRTWRRKGAGRPRVDNVERIGHTSRDYYFFSGTCRRRASIRTAVAVDVRWAEKSNRNCGGVDYKR